MAIICCMCVRLSSAWWVVGRLFDGYEMDNIDEAPPVSVERPSSSGVNEFTPVEGILTDEIVENPWSANVLTREESESPGRVTTDDALADDRMTTRQTQHRERLNRMTGIAIEIDGSIVMIV